MKLNEIIIIPSGDFEGKDFDSEDEDYKDLFADSVKLPGGSDYRWAYAENESQTEIYIFDPSKTYLKEIPIAYTLLEYTKDSEAKTVSSIQVDKNYRGHKIGLSLYGIALSILKYDLISDDLQTPDGVRMWGNIAKVSGVKVCGVYNKQFTDHYYKNFTKNLTVEGLKVWNETMSEKISHSDFALFSERIGAKPFNKMKHKFSFPVSLSNAGFSNKYIDIYRSVSIQLYASKQ